MTYGEIGRPGFIDALSGSRLALYGVTASLALLGGEATVGMATAQADPQDPQCVTTVNGDTTTTSCESTDGSSTSTTTTTSSPSSPNSPQPTEAGSTPVPVSTPNTQLTAPSPSNTTTASRPAGKTKHSSGSPARRVSHRYVDLNMHEVPGPLGREISSDGCGVIALTDDVRYETGKNVSATTIAGQISRWWDKGAINNVPDPYAPADANYMSGAAPHIASIYHLREYETDLNGAEKAIKLGGAAIMLAAEGQFTADSHYMALQRFVNGRFQDFDPNQPGHNNDKTWWTPRGLLDNDVQPRVWVFTRQKTQG